MSVDEVYDFVVFEEVEVFEEDYGLLLAKRKEGKAGLEVRYGDCSISLTSFHLLFQLDQGDFIRHLFYLLLNPQGVISDQLISLVELLVYLVPELIVAFQ